MYRYHHRGGQSAQPHTSCGSIKIWRQAFEGSGISPAVMGGYEGVSRCRRTQSSFEVEVEVGRAILVDHFVLPYCPMRRRASPCCCVHLLFPATCRDIFGRWRQSISGRVRPRRRQGHLAGVRISLGLISTLHTSQAVVWLRLAFPLPSGMPRGSLVLDNYGMLN